MKIDREQILRVLVDAADFGDEKAAERHAISRKTITRYRARLAADPELVGRFAAFKGQLDERWMDEAARVRMVLLGRMAELAAKPDADLYRVAGAYKIVTDAQFAAQIVGSRWGNRHEGESSNETRSRISTPPAAASRTIDDGDGRWRQ